MRSKRTALGVPRDAFESGDADRPHCTTCRLLVRQPSRIWLLLLYGTSAYTGPQQRHSLLSESAARPTSQRVVWHLRAQIVPRVWTRPRNHDVHKNKKVPRREARHCSVRGRSSRRVDQARAKSKPKTPIALAVITAPTSRALLAGRDVGDDPLSPDGHGPRDFDAAFVDAAFVHIALVHAALAFATWVAIASISAGDRQS
jgi:hypothetical protein